MFGEGLIKGLVVTARNFVGSYYDPARFVTVEYPEHPRPVFENNRNFPFLVYDGDDPEKGLRCVACKICEQSCPPQCIYIVTAADARGNLIPHPKIFDIDISVCMGCQICAEVCPFDSIKMDQAFELATPDRFKSLLYHKADLARPNALFHRLHPQEAAAVDAQMAAVRELQSASAHAVVPNAGGGA